MKLIIASILVVAAVADRLEKTYLPPGSAGSAGGSGSFLRAPGFGASPARVQPAPKFGGSSFGGSSFGGSSFGSKFGSSGFGSKYGSNSGGSSFQAQTFSSSGSSGRIGGGAASGRDAGASILKYNSDNSGDGSYRFEFETENKISQQESGELKNAGTDQESSAVYGSYTYTGLDGQTYVVNYVADENGFRPTGDHLPTPPPIPAEILKSLSQQSSGGHHEGSYSGSNQGSYSGSNQGSYSGSSQGGFSSGSSHRGGSSSGGSHQGGFSSGGFKQSSFSSGFQSKGGFSSGNSFGGSSQPSRQYLTPKGGY